jgi:hypothetical protein
VSVYVLYRAELRADFQQYYGLNLDGLGREYTLRHAADLVLMLPKESRVKNTGAPDDPWSMTDRLLAGIANSLRLLWWAQTKDGHKNRNRPELIDLSLPKTRKGEELVLSVDEYKKRIENAHREVR